MVTFKSLGLNAQLLKAVEKLGFENPTEIQTKVIPLLLEQSKDLVALAQTGTGKTAAFALPTLHRLRSHGNCRALALAPTRELAIQIEENFRKYGKFLDLKLALLYGGVKYGKQLEELKSNPDIVIATPGRLIDHIQQGNLSLKNIEILILDEVDRMLDMGFVEDVTKIIQKTPQSRQTLLFSATIPDAVIRLSKWALNNPAEAKIDIKISAAETVSHALYPVPAIQKFDLLIALLKKIDFENLIIFFQTRRGTDKISRWLTEHGQDVRVLHSDLKQRDRISALQDFKDGKVKILSATDVASRGLDISNVTHVINYDVPQHSEDYVHRIGRTGRARTEGEAFTLCKPEEIPLVESVEKLLGNPLPRKFLDDFPYRESQESLAPTGIEVSKKRNRGFGRQASFGSRRRR